MKRKINSFTEGSIIRAMVVLSIPILIANLLQTAYQIIDTFWVGRLSAEAVAAVSLSFPVIFFIITFAGGIGMAGAVFVAQYKGRQESEKINHFTGQTFMMAFSVSIVSSAIGYFLTPAMMNLLGAGPDVFSDAVSYLRVSFLGLFFVFGYLIFQSIVRGVGDAKTPAYIVLMTVILNFFLDPLFIFGWGPVPALGVSGAAMATLVTQALALITGLILLFRGKSGICLRISHFKPDFPLIKRIIKLGFPISLEQSTRTIGFIIMVSLVSGFGTVILAGYGIGMRIMSLVIIPATSLAIASSTLVGQNMGAGKTERAEEVIRKGICFGFIILTLLGILFFIFAEQISLLFIPNNPAVVSSSVLFMKIISLSFGFIGVQMALYGGFRGAGNVTITMKISLILMIIQVLAAFILSRYTFLKEMGLWISFPLLNVAGAATLLFIFSQGKWKNIRITEK